MTVCIDDIYNFGSVLEVEVITLPYDLEETKKNIQNFLYNLGVHDDQIIQKIFTTILMQKSSIF